MKTGKGLILMACVVMVVFTAGFSSAAEGNESTNDVVLGKNGLGIEFFSLVSGKSTFTQESVTFNGKGTPPLTETQTVDVKFNRERPTYDIGIFYRVGRFKFGIIPTSLIYNAETIITDIPYNKSYGPWTLGHNELNADFYNIMYGEYYGMKAKQVYFNLAFRLDWAQASIKSQTYKYPYGDEWDQSPIVLDEKKYNEKFAVVSLGPKITVDLKGFDFFKDPLRYFQKLGLDVSVLWDMPIGYAGYKGYSINISLASEF